MYKRQIVKTIVTTDLVKKIASSYGAETYEVFTGFKNIAEIIKNKEGKGEGEYLFGFEESYGYLPGTYARDKDACLLYTSNQLFAAYARGKEAKELMVILGESALTEVDRLYAKFADDFEKVYISQGYETDRSIAETLNIGWDLLSILPRSEMKRIKDEYVEKYLDKKEG